MFQEKEREAYQSMKVPVELKNRIRSSIDQQRKRTHKQQMTVLAAAACLAVMISAGGLFDNSTIISVNDAVVSHKAVELEASANYSLATASEGRSSEPLIQVPMEIQVTEEAHIRVSQGTLQQVIETDMDSEIMTEMDINGTTVINWTVNGDISNTPTCTITAGEKVYTYVISFDEADSVFTIKQVK